LLSWLALAGGLAAVVVWKSAGPLCMIAALFLWNHLRSVMKPSIEDCRPPGSHSLVRAMVLYATVTVVGLIYIAFGNNRQVLLFATAFFACCFLYFLSDDFRTATYLYRTKKRSSASDG